MTRAQKLTAGLGAAVLATLGVVVACGPLPYDPASVIEGVRVLATRTETPFALPGERVEVEMLVVDGRREPVRPLTVGWLPVLCVNPAADLYLACFAPGARLEVNAEGLSPTPAPVDAGAGDAGQSSDAGEGDNADQTPPPSFALDFGALAGTDITRLLVPGTRFGFDMPEDVIIPHERGGDYGLVVMFNVACAGRVRIAAFKPEAGLEQMPLECVDDEGNVLGADDFTVGFTRVYAYSDRRNQNPVITGVTHQGKPVDLSAGVRVPVCTEKNRTSCESLDFDVQVRDDAQEEKTGEPPLRGEPVKEQVYAQLYTTLGIFSPEAVLLYDSASGLVEDRRAGYLPPQRAGQGRVYVVARDDRGGVNWVDFPIVAE